MKNKRNLITIILGIMAVLSVSCIYSSVWEKNREDETLQETDYQQQILKDDAPGENANSDSTVTNAESLQSGKKDTSIEATNESTEESTEEPMEQINEYTLINPRGSTVESRILPPIDFKRLEAPEGSILTYMRNLELKPDKSPVMLFNGREKENQTAQSAVFAFDVGENDLQQCADSIMRVYGEYYWSIGAFDKINFHLTNGFLMDYLSWREGKRIKVEGNKVSWFSSTSYDDSYECFRKYLTQVMVYAGTLSLSQESTTIDKEELRVGDMIIQGGSPGHCVLVVDVAVNLDGEECYLLAQGYMPAQDFHIINNPRDAINPWYYNTDIDYPIRTPEYIFRDGSIKRWMEGFN